MEIDQVYKAPSIPKLNRRNIKSTLISGAIKPGVELKKTKFSFIKPLAKLIPDSLIPDKSDENKREGLVKYIQSNFGIQKVLEQSNKLLSQIKEQLSLDFLSRIREEKKDLEESKKRIAAEKVKDKEKKLESGGVKGFLGKTFSTLLAPAKSIFQKLIDFFSIILTGILVNTAFKWLQKPENQEKLKQFFQFLKDYWKELLVVFGAIKLLGLVRKVLKVANALKSLIEFFKKKPQLPCNCPKSPAQKGGLPDCEPIKDCVDSLVKDPKKGPGFLENLAQSLLGTKAFAPFLLLINKPVQTPQPNQQPANKPVRRTQPLRTPLDTRKGATVDQIYEEWNKNYQPASSGLPKGLSDYINNIQNQPTAEEKLFKQLNLPSWSIPIVEAVLTSATMGLGRGRGIRPGGIKINPQQYSRPLGPYPQPIQNPVRPVKPVNTTLNAPELPAQPTRLSDRIRVSSTGGKKTRVGNQKLSSSLLSKDDKQLVSKVINDPQTADKFLEFLPKSPSFTRSGSNLKNLKNINDFAELQGIPVEQLIQSQVKIFRQYLQNQYVVGREKGGTIPKISLFAGGGTVGGPGALGVDSVPAAIASGAGKLANYGKALLAPGEEVINTRASMLFRPLLKDINDNAARMWQSFTNAVRRQDAVNSIKSGIIEELNKILEEFRALLDKESNDIKRKNRSARRPPGGGGFRPSFGGENALNPRRITPSSNIQSSSQNIQPIKMPKVDMSVDSSKISSQPQQKITPPQISTIEPKVTISNPIDITQKIIEQPVRVPIAEKSFVDNTKLYVIPVKETIGSTSKYQVSKQKPSINYITLPTKTVNLGSTGSKPSVPSSSSGTTVPSISPIDQSNDYVFTTPSMYGILVV